MTEKEWIQVGKDSGVIEDDPVGVPAFSEVYKQWFNYKRGQIKAQSLDRIECTFMKYYVHSELMKCKINTIGETEVISFLNGIFSACGSMTLKEYRKIYQIINNVLVYALDFKVPGARLLNWKMIRDYVYSNHIISPKKDVAAVKDSDIALLHDFVLSHGYVQKQSACLLLIANFYLGLRVGELSALEWSDIDFENRVIYVSKSETKSYDRLPDGTRGQMRYVISEPKTSNSVRRVPLCDKGLLLLRLLKQHHEHMGYGSDRLVYDGADIIGSLSLDGTLRKICKMAGVPVFNTHMIRKTVATKMHYNGMPTRIIADILGHADISTTERCYILTDVEYYNSIGHTLNDVLSY